MSRYERIYAINREDWHTCYYCGDIEDVGDYIPPRAVAECFSADGGHADYLIVPCCLECSRLGADEPHGKLEHRATYIRARLKERYAKDWERSQVWNKSEVAELIEEDGETSIARSASAIRVYLLKA
jgi:hypothetical protein